jgi:hypothetical protein
MKMLDTFTAQKTRELRQYYQIRDSFGFPGRCLHRKQVQAAEEIQKLEKELANDNSHA